MGHSPPPSSSSSFLSVLPLSSPCQMSGILVSTVTVDRVEDSIHLHVGRDIEFMVTTKKKCGIGDWLGSLLELIHY